ncbi:MAG: hypothetical protein IKL86_03605, partial [Clostridia bacterium]|nr:hypothetical protein [Clostridia bacterium]
MLRRLVILFIVLLSAVTISTVAIGVADKVVPTCEDGHTWDLALVTEQATCTEEGKLTKTCKVCGETEEIVMDALGHDLVAVAGSAKEPSCEEDGYTGDKECLRSGCSYIEEGEVIPADGHDYDKVVTAPTCEEDGYTTYTCDCGKSYIADEVDALGHAYGEWTSNGDGTHKRVCANDTAHVESGNCAGGTATCQELAECSVCGGEYGELLAHTYNQEVATSEYLEYAANCQSPATYFKSCVCGAKGTETFTVGTPSGNHNYDREVVHEDYIASGATCTEPAKYFYTCVCGLKGTATFSNGEALGHTWEEVVLEGETNKATDATCVTKATYYKVCDCNTVSTNETFEYGDYADHDYSYEVAADEYIAIKGNCQTATTYFKSCVCGEASTTDTFVGDEVGDHDFSEDNECVCGLVKVTATVSIEDVATENGWVSNSQYPSFVVDSHIKVSSVGGQHTGKYNSNEHSYRIYATDTTPGSITISAEYIQNLVSIKFTTEEGEYAFLYLDGTTEDVCNKVVNVDGNSVTFNSVKNGENGKHVRITAIEVVYVYKPCTTHIAGETKGYDETQHWDICSQCGEKMTETVENHIYDGTPENTSAKQHTVSCDCGATTKEDHSYNATSGKCDCGAEKPSEGDEPAGPVTITTVIEDYATANHWADATMYDTVMMDDIITVTAAGSGDIAKYYLNGFEWRMYQAGNNEFTVVAVDGYEIISVKVIYRIKNSGVMTYNGANVATETLVEVNATSATFGVGNTGDKTNGQVKITAIEVIYKEAASSSEPTCEHTNTTIDQVNVVNATCTEDGSYEEVVTCDACGEELSRTHKTTSKTAHTPAEAVQEDVVPATCYAEGSYNSVV